MDDFRVVVIGDGRSGKSTLIKTALTGKFHRTTASVIPPSCLPKEFSDLDTGVTILDSDGLEDLSELIEQVDSVILVYECGEQAYGRLSEFWLPRLQNIFKTGGPPLLVVGCKLDLLKKECNQSEIDGDIQCRGGILAFKFPSLIDEYFEFSAKQCPGQARTIFYHAVKSVLLPKAPLYDDESKSLSFRLLRALKRIFDIYDKNNDGFLSLTDLRSMEADCYGEPFGPLGVAGIRDILRPSYPQGLKPRGLTLFGLFHLHLLFFREGFPERTWSLLLQWGYDLNVKFREDRVPFPSSFALDQSVELTSEAIEFLEDRFRSFDLGPEGDFSPIDIAVQFQAARECPWYDAHLMDEVENTTTGGLSVRGYLSMWALMALRKPTETAANLIDACYTYPERALRITRSRLVDCIEQQSERNVYQGFVFGPKEAGKSKLLDSFLGRPFSGRYTSTTTERFAATMVDRNGGAKKTLVLREIPEERLENLLLTKTFLAACDVAIFVFDSSDKCSWMLAYDMLVRVASQGMHTGYRVPCITISASDEIDMDVQQQSERANEMMRIVAPIPFSMPSEDPKDVFVKIIQAAEGPYENLPVI